MKKLLSRLLPRTGTSRQAQPAFTAPVAPDRSFVAIGDIHGRADLLGDLERRLEAECPGWPVVFLGDYVDRGEQSREVLERLMAVSEEDKPEVTCLMGNHERMLLDMLDNPERATSRWLRNGGLQVLASFGVALPRRNSANPAALNDMRDALATAMGDSMIAWLRARPLRWQNGNVWALHAGADPRHPISEQTEDILLWGHPDFQSCPRADGQWIVHGHTIVDIPYAVNGCIAVDTGAYATGRLSAAVIGDGDVRFLHTGRNT
jgi:serine/threonine protein phosphatase 1